MTPIAWLLLIILIIEIILLVPLSILFFFDTEVVKARKIKKRAKHDYKNARGTVHRKLLEDAIDVILSRKKQNISKIESTRREISHISHKRNIEIQQALVRWLVYTRLYEAHGIGETTSNRIYYGVFKGRLSDLRNAYNLNGIGPQKQYYINQWVDKYQQRLPKLIKSQKFPERQEIIDKHNPPILKLKRKLVELRKDNQRLEIRRQPIEKELKWLRTVSPADFVAAYKGPPKSESVIDRYFVGVFADWEPIPDWFKTEIGSRSS